MKTWIIASLMIAALANSSNGQIVFEKLTLAEALEKAAAEDKKIFVDVYTTWCGPCKRLDKDVFSDKALGERMSKSFICLKVDNENSPDRANFAEYGIKAYPTMLILQAKTGTLIQKTEGYRSVEDFNDILDQQLPEEQRPQYIAYKAMQDNPNDQKLWKEKLPLIKRKYYDKFDSLCQVYVDRFGLDKIEDEMDETIFGYSVLPLSSPVVQEILQAGVSGEHKYGLYTYLAYFKLSIKEQYKAAQTAEARQAIRKEADETYFAAEQALFGDIESKEYFLEGLFPENDPEPIKEEKPELIKEDPNNPKAKIAEAGGRSD